MRKNNRIIVIMSMLSAVGAMFLALNQPIITLFFCSIAIVGLVFAAVRESNQKNQNNE
ncbi:hypothetical protein PN462_01570 [Spirulina sp. CS-785/01]|uniref:hypothetical protein n=1 Tax=Spirulina sp. CS-785/01 TaxID=3021716 RepID=UPI0023304CFD|nr:hypothetical protein [Spirulina sp. CS-785/01]MDB9311773.1 hypothetical protein [Spirulina sp. CS-785/01]